MRPRERLRLLSTVTQVAWKIAVHAFEYLAPTTLDEAIDALSKHNGSARPLAGGTDLIDQMRVGRRQPELLVDVKKVPELMRLEVADGQLHVGAALPCYRLTESAEVREDFAALAECCEIIGGIQIQTRASIGGNLCNSGPAADSIPAMIALGGVCVIAGPDGRRECPVESFCTGPGQNVLQPGELLVEVRFPARAANSGSHYRRLIPRNEMDIAIVGVGAKVQLSDDGKTITQAKIGLGAVAPTPLYAEAASESLTDQPAEEASYQAAAESAQSIVQPITDMRGTEAYRVHATGVLVRRVLAAAVANARGESTDYQPGR